MSLMFAPLIVRWQTAARSVRNLCRQFVQLRLFGKLAQALRLTRRRRRGKILCSVISLAAGADWLPPVLTY